MRQSMRWAVLMGLTVVGCSNSSTPVARPTASELKEGVNILKADPAWGMNAAFLQNGRVIYFESRLGPLKPEIYRTEFPNEPANEIDARYIDANGSTFKVQIGGDAYIDATWDQDIAVNRMHPIDRDLDFKASRDFAAALKIQAVNMPAMQDHIYNAALLGAHVPSEMPEMQAKLTAIKAQLPADAQYNNSCYWNWFEADLYGKCIFACIAHHSAVIGWNYSNCTSSWDEEKVACNHGTCATDSSMGYQCYRNASAGWVGNYTDIYALRYETTTSNQSVTSGCSTSYNWNTPPGHLCNDDSRYELMQVVSASTNTSWGNNYSFNSTDSNGHNYGCSCGSYGASCSGDWSIPSCN